MKGLSVSHMDPVIRRSVNCTQTQLALQGQRSFLEYKIRGLVNTQLGERVCGGWLSALPGHEN